MRLNASPVNAVAVNAPSRGIRAILLSALVSATTTAKRSFSLARTATAAAVAPVARALHLLFAAVALGAAQSPALRRLYLMLAAAYVATHSLLSRTRSLGMRASASAGMSLRKGVTKSALVIAVGTSSLRRQFFVSLSAAVEATTSLLRRLVKHLMLAVSTSARSARVHLRDFVAQARTAAATWILVLVARATYLFNTLETTYIAARSRVSVMVARARAASLRIRK